MHVFRSLVDSMLTRPSQQAKGKQGHMSRTSPDALAFCSAATALTAVLPFWHSSQHSARSALWKVMACAAGQRAGVTPREATLHVHADSRLGTCARECCCDRASSMAQHALLNPAHVCGAAFVGGHRDGGKRHRQVVA